ncbi:DNRLRE domain-containing protein, partial [Parafrankia elaeagni]|uniref:DNRLRE domain-containing protein n=1 Tax=Parafrankia elaeagni TaxID=222534 RepID=UPI00036F3099
MPGRHLPAPAPDPASRPDPHPSGRRHRRRRARPGRLQAVALLLIPVIMIVAMVVVERTRDGSGRRPISQENPFRDMNLPESSSGSADGRGHEVPTEATQSVAAPDPAAVDRAVPDVPGTVPTTVDKPIVFEKPSARRDGGAPPTSVTAKIGRIDEAVKDPPVPADAAATSPRAGRTEMVERRTETTSVFRNPDGTFTSEISQGPVNFRDTAGTWQKIDTTLVPAERGRLRVAATDVATDIATTASDPRLARLEIEDGVSAAFGIAEAASADAAVDGSVATYADVREAADLQVGSTPNGLKDVIILKSREAPTSWTFPLTLEGLTAKIVDGQVQLTDRAGKLRGLVPVGWMKDSGTTGVAGTPAESYGVDYTLVTLDSGQQALRVDLDEDWLRDPARVFPVMVDPPLVAVLPDWQNDTFVSSYEQGPHGSDPALKVGRYIDNVHHSYAQFGGSQFSFLTNATVLGAAVQLFNKVSASCTPLPVSLYEVTQSWDGNTMPWPGASIGAEVAQSSFAYGGASCTPGGNWVTFSDPRLTQLVDDWTHGVKQNTGVSIRTSTTNTQYFKAFESYECASPCNPANPATDLRPRMSVTWSPYDARYSWATNPAVWEQWLTDTQQGKIRINVRNEGQANWPANGSFKLSYKVYDSTGLFQLPHTAYETVLPSAVNRGQTINLLTTMNPLPVGNYIVRFDMKDGGTFFSDHLLQPFTVPISVSAAVNYPPAVTGASPGNGANVNSLTPTLALTGSDPDATAGGLRYSFRICEGSDADSGACWNSGAPQTGTSWRVPAGALQWGRSYYWVGKVTDGAGAESLWTAPIRLYTQPPTPSTAGYLGNNPYAPAVSSVTPVIGNFTTATTDATVPGAGPALSVTRTYNSRNDDVGIFGPGWTSEWDMNASPDLDGEGGLLVTYPDGRQGRFGRNWDGTYLAQDGFFSLVQAPSPKVASFTAPDSTMSLGPTDTGENWQILDGTWGISANNAYLVSGSIWQRNAAVTSAAADGTIKFTAPVAQDGIGVAFRVQDIDNMWMLYLQPSTNSLVLAKRVAGWETQVATVANGCCAPTDTYAVTMSGGTFSILRNNRVIGSASDSQFSTVTRAGLYVASAGAGRIGSIAMVDDQHRDSVTRANSTTSLGSTDNGEKWLPSTNTVWGVSGNSAYLVTASGNRNVATVSGSSDGAFSFTMPAAQGGVGLAFRYADVANYWRLVAQPGSGNWQLVKRDDGVETTVATAAGCCTAGDVLRIETNGPQIRVLRNGTQIMLVNDPAVFYGSRVGPFAETTGAGRIDDMVFSAAAVLTDKAGTAHAFRSDGRLARVTDAAARQLQFAYNSDARLTSVTNPTSGRAITLTWTGDRVTQVATPAVTAHGGPLAWTYGYASGRLTSVTAPHTSTPTTYAYASNGRLNQITLPRGNIDTKVGYNTDGTVAWREDGRGKRTTFAVLSTSPTTTIRITDPRGHATDWEYKNGQLISHRDGADERRFTYNDRGFVTQIQDENDNIVVLNTDGRGNVRTRTTTRAVVGGSPATYTEYYDYFLGAPGDPRNDLVTAFRDGRSESATDNEFKTTYTYNTYGDLVTQRTAATADFPSGRTESWAFTAGAESAIGGGTVPRDLPLSYTDARGKITTYGYDSKGDLRRDQDPAGLVHEYTYDEIGRRLTSREISDTYPAGLATSYSYNKLSRVASITQPGVTNPITSVTHAAMTVNTYDLNGNLTQVAVSDTTGGDATRTTTYTYDNADQQTSTTEGAGSPLARTTSVTYDDNNNIATSIDANGTVTSYTYTAKNLLATTTIEDFVDDPVAGSTPRDLLAESRSYDPAGRLASITDAEGRTTEYTYWLDDLPRQEIAKGFRPPDLVNKVLSTAGARDVVLLDLTYDGAGNQISTTSDGGLTTIEQEYDPADRLISSTLDPDGLARKVTYTYDATNNVISTVFGAAGTSASERIDATYDNASRLTSETVFGDGTDAFVTTYQNDQRGFATAVTDPRGYVAGGSPNPAFTTTLKVDPAGQATQVKSPPVPVEEWGAGPTDQQHTADDGYNTFGEVTHSRDTRGNVTTTVYNVLGQASQVSGQPYTPPGGSAITPTESWTYDDNGNTLTHTDPRGETTTAVYDKLDRPVAITDPQVGSATAGVSRILYDDVGNVVSTVDQLGAWTFFAYDDLDRVWATTETERTPAATFSTYTVHNDAGDVTRVLTPANATSGLSWTGVYNAAGELVEERDEGNNLTTHSYDLLGRPVSTADPLGRSTSVTYDRAGRPVRTAEYSPTHVELRSASTGYDAAGNPVSETDANGWTTTSTFDALSQLRTVTEPVDASTSITTTFGYAKGGKLTRRTDGRGNRVIYTYNPLLLRESVVEAPTTAHPAAADREWKTSYDAGGLPVSETAPGGVVRSRTFDELGRLTVETGSGGGATGAARSLTYDLAGRVT